MVVGVGAGSIPSANHSRYGFLWHGMLYVHRLGSTAQGFQWTPFVLGIMWNQWSCTQVSSHFIMRCAASASDGRTLQHLRVCMQQCTGMVCTALIHPGCTILQDVHTCIPRHPLDWTGVFQIPCSSPSHQHHACPETDLVRTLSSAPVFICL